MSGNEPAQRVFVPVDDDDVLMILRSDRVEQGRAVSRGHQRDALVPGLLPKQ